MSIARRLQLVGCTTEDKWMETALKVAFATSDMKRVDQHFGAAQSFAIYALDQQKVCFVEAVEFGKLDMDGNEDKLVAKIDALKGCIAVYSQAVGASAINQLKMKGIQPVKISPGASISSLLESLQQELREGPGSWLARAIKNTMPADPSRFDEMEQEGWEE
ncbi:MAG: nitrogen fixation protein NifX [gamma proteobacterium symbiont of Stewartia floridana]|nr:NifB/NifX family molybdenum-iron cluster-binding protein [Candidatus Thiodiazotropha taylori]MCG7961232.1 NifB/NifX family molybdenum-iron cluster-binding protein [Candidatus Thiodiazotropha endolucinida]MCG8017691.1 NifB/NifX family molybdenum-iron cluster-binding protein [Candidatus Thiodiazotropha sp. 'RUGA']RLW55221.1 MAG: nitrogen fixation protein NifX [gamma proteobacterium symbiont of Stewartia floridana]MCG7894106.1 NifB/NifX family molybdenum-iron cluster-binding protein [Candidatus